MKRLTKTLFLKFTKNELHFIFKEEYLLKIIKSSVIKVVQFFKSTIIVSSITLISRFSGFIRDCFFAKYLGTGYQFDIFLVAYRFPNLFRNIFAEGALNSSFVPILSSELAKKNNEKNTLQFIKNIFSIMFFLLLLLTILVELFMPFLVKITAPTFSQDYGKYMLSIALSRITFPYLILISITSLFSGVLNSLNKFFITSITPVILNISFILFCFLSSFINVQITFLLSYSILIGGIIQLIVVFFSLKQNGFHITFTKIEYNKLTANFFKTFLNATISSAVLQLNSMVDSIFATAIVGGVSYIYYTERLIQLPLSLIGTAFSITLLPVLSREVSLNSEKRFEIQEECLFYGLFLGLPCFVCLFLFSNTIVPFLFQGGKFSYQDSLIVIACLKIYVVVIPLYIITKIFQTIFFANRDTKTPLKASICCLLSNAILDFILVKHLSYRGILLSTVLSAFLNIAILLFQLHKKKYIKFSMNFLIKTLKLIYPIMFLVISCLLFNRFLLNGKDTKLITLIKLSISGGVVGSIYLIISLMLGLFDPRLIFTKNRKNA